MVATIFGALEVKKRALLFAFVSASFVCNDCWMEEALALVFKFSRLQKFIPEGGSTELGLAVIFAWSDELLRSPCGSTLNSFEMNEDKESRKNILSYTAPIRKRRVTLARSTLRGRIAQDSARVRFC